MRTRIIQQIGGLVVLALLVGGVFAFSSLTVDPKLAARNANLGAELSRVESRNRHLQDEIAEMKREITRLRDSPTESLHHARTNLGMVRGDEIVYQFRARPAAPAPSPGGAR